MATATIQKEKTRLSSTDIYNKYLKDLPVTERKEIVFILINSFVGDTTQTTSTTAPKQQDTETQEETDESFNERFRKKHGYKYRKLSPELQWVHDHPIVLSEEALKDERTQYILSKCSPLQ